MGIFESLLPWLVSLCFFVTAVKIGVVLSGGQAPGSHNAISGIFDYLQDRAKGSILYGFRGGPADIVKCKYLELTSDLFILIEIRVALT